MYVMFGIVVLVLGDHIEKLLEGDVEYSKSINVQNNSSNVLIRGNNNSNNNNSKDNTLRNPGDNFSISSPVEDIDKDNTYNKSMMIGNNNNSNIKDNDKPL